MNRDQTCLKEIAIQPSIHPLPSPVICLGLIALDIYCIVHNIRLQFKYRGICNIVMMIHKILTLVAH